jgi:prolyl oligopeptidase
MPKVPVPTTRLCDVVENIHGFSVHDPYRWLEESASPEVQKWVESQNAYARRFFDRRGVRQTIKKRLKELFKLDTVAVPVPKQGRYFSEERKGGQDLKVLYVQDGLRAAPRVLVDPNTLSADRKTTIAEWHPSQDGKLLVYGLSAAGNDLESLHLLNVDSGRKLADHIPEVGYPRFGAWAHDGKGFWYVRRAFDAPANGGEKFYQRLYYHELGSDPRNDCVVFGEGREKTDYLFARASKNGRWLLVGAFVSTGEKEQIELYLKELKIPGATFQPVIEGKEALFIPLFHRNRLYILTNHGAPNWKIMAITADAFHEGQNHWVTIIPEGNAFIMDFLAVRDRLYVQTLKNVHSVLREYSLAGSLRREIPLPTMGSIGPLSAEEEGNEMFFGFTSFTVPHDVYRLELDSEVAEIIKQAAGGIRQADFEVNQIWYASKDGTPVPMFVVAKKGLCQNGTNPVMLYGYGGFNIPVLPNFDKTMVSFLEAGGIYAVANIRGGSEFGEKWHSGGMRKNKQNVFDDFIAAAEFLINNQYTSRAKLVIFGWSNGGLLTGACLTQRPDLYRAVVIGNPVLDMLRYHLFDGGRVWIPDYGCVEEPDILAYLLGYSPYHNIREGTHYPATLILTSDNDDRVHPGQAYKMAARLQKANRSQNPVLLRVEIKAGHQGAAGIAAIIEQFSDIWSFIFQQLGIGGMKQGE